MNKICKEYITEIKSFFPIYRKPERVFIKKLTLDIEDFCEESKTTNKSKLYDKYGKPNDIVNNYLSSVGIEYISKQIRISRYIKITIIALVILAIVVTSIFCCILYRQHKMDMRQEMVGVNSIINEIE